MKTPGVYIVEKSAFPNSVVEVGTAVPAFIGYTEKAIYRQRSFREMPRRITSMAEFHQYFGLGPDISFKLREKAPGTKDEAGVTQDGKEYVLSRANQTNYLYYSMMLFYQNGGGPCYVVSVGNFNKAPDSKDLMAGIHALINEQEPTMIVVPDAMLLKKPLECADVQKQAMDHCKKMQSRVAILDVYEGYKGRTEEPDCVSAFRNALGVTNLDYAAAYYPWLDTTVVQGSSLGYKNFDSDSVATLQAILQKELNISAAPAAKAVKQDEKRKEQSSLIQKLDGENWDEEDKKALETNEALLNKGLVAMSPVFNSLLEKIKDQVNLLPPSGAIAGVYTMVDNSRGVWKAPANVRLNGVLKPAVSISHDEQEDLNVNAQGKSINAIRDFIGEGTLVWGARTLDGNSLDWRYINVRRTMIMLEQSIKLASKAYVFEANDASTWVTMKSMIRNFLTGIWKRGGLAGAVPDDAFSVHIGLGETMTPVDILEGILRVTVLVAVTRPAEFIELTFQQKMHKS